MHFAQKGQAASRPLTHLSLDGMVDACEGLLTSCLHAVPHADPQIPDRLLPCDEADARQSTESDFC